MLSNSPTLEVSCDSKSLCADLSLSLFSTFDSLACKFKVDDKGRMPDTIDFNKISDVAVASDRK